MKAWARIGFFFIFLFLLVFSVVAEATAKKPIKIIKGEYLQIGRDPLSPYSPLKSGEYKIRTEEDLFLKMEGGRAIYIGTLRAGTEVVVKKDGDSRWKIDRVWECGNTIFNKIYVNFVGDSLTTTVTQSAPAPTLAPVQVVLSLKEIEQKVGEPVKKIEPVCLGMGTAMSFSGGALFVAGLVTGQVYMIVPGAILLVAGLVDAPAMLGATPSMVECRLAAAVIGGFAGWLLAGSGSVAGSSSTTGGGPVGGGGIGGPVGGGGIGGPIGGGAIP